MMSEVWTHHGWGDKLLASSIRYQLLGTGDLECNCNYVVIVMLVHTLSSIIVHRQSLPLSEYTLFHYSTWTVSSIIRVHTLSSIIRVHSSIIVHRQSLPLSEYTLFHYSTWTVSFIIKVHTLSSIIRVHNLSSIIRVHTHYQSTHSLPLSEYTLFHYQSTYSSTISTYSLPLSEYTSIIQPRPDPVSNFFCKQESFCG